MNRDAIRHHFRRLFGAEKTAKFILSLHRTAVPKGRLLFWQENMLGQLSAHFGARTVDLDLALELFSYCFIHETELLQNTAAFDQGLPRTLDARSAIIQDRDLPFACGSRPGLNRKAGVYCPCCRRELQDDLDALAPPASLLTWLYGKSAHPDVVQVLKHALATQAGVRFVYSDEMNYGYVLAFINGNPFAFVAGTEVTLRLPACQVAQALQLGGISIAGLGEEWISLCPYQSSPGLSECERLTRNAFTFARHQVRPL